MVKSLGLSKRVVYLSTYYFENKGILYVTEKTRKRDAR